jgi:hypothetical protein
MSLAFFGGLAEGALDARKEQAAADRDAAKSKAKSKQEEDKQIAALHKAIANTGVMTAQEMYDLGGIRDIRYLTSMLADKTKLQQDNKTAADLSATRVDFSKQGLAFLHSNKNQNVLVPGLASIAKNTLGLDGQTFTQALGTLPGATRIADTTFNMLDTVLSSDPDMPLDKFQRVVDTRLGDLINASQHMPQHATGVKQGSEMYFRKIHQAFKGKDHLDVLRKALVEHKFFKPSSRETENAKLNMDKAGAGEGGETAVVAITNVGSTANIGDVTVVDDTFPLEMGSHEKAIFGRANLETNKPYNVDTQGAVPQYGLKTIVRNLDQAVSQGVSVDNKYNSFAESWVNASPAARQLLDLSSAFEVLDDRVTEKNRQFKTTVYRNRRTGLTTKEVVEILPNAQDKLREDKFAQDLIRQGAALNGASRTVRDIELIAQNVGIMMALENPANATLETIFKDSNAEEISRIYGVLSQYINDNNSTVVVDGAGNSVRVMNKNNFHNALLTAIGNQDEIVTKRLREVGVDSGLVMSGAATGVGTFIDNFATGLQGLINQFDTYVGRTRELYSVNSPAAFNNARNTLKTRLNVDFDQLIAGEREKMAANRNTYNNATDSRQKLLAYSRAQISFYKINLAYQYAAISQGGEGSARTISDTDFAKNFLALFQESGPGFLGVVDLIKRQTKIQLAANRLLLNKAKEGRFSKFYPEVNALGEALQFQHSIREKRRPIRSVATLGGSLDIGKRDTGEGAAAQATLSTDVTDRDINIYFNNHETGAEATPLVSKRGDKSFKLDFADANFQESFYSSFQLLYAPKLKEMISKAGAKNFGTMEEKNAENWIDNNKDTLIFHLFNINGVLGQIKPDRNPFRFVNTKDIKGFKSMFPKKPISLIINDWNKTDDFGRDKFYHLRTDRLNEKFPKEVERLKGEEFIFEKLTDIIMSYMRKNWGRIDN